MYYLTPDLIKGPIVLWLKEKKTSHDVLTDNIYEALKVQTPLKELYKAYPCHLIDPFCTSQSERLKEFLLPKMVEVTYPDGEIECMAEADYNAKLISGTELATVTKRY